MRKVLISASLLLLLLSYKVTGQPSLDYELYLTQIAASEAFLQLNKIHTAKEYLDKCKPELRGFEWKFLNAFLNQESRVVALENIKVYNCIEMNPMGNTLAVASPDSSILIYNYPEMTLKHRLQGHSASVSTLAYSRDGKLLASGGRDHCVILWDMVDGKIIAKNNYSFSKGIYQLSFNNDNTFLGVVSWEMQSKNPPVQGFVKLLDSHTLKEIQKWETDAHPASGVRFSNDGTRLIVSTWGEIVYAFDINTEKTIWTYNLSDPEEYNSFHSMDLSADGNTLALGSTDHRIHVLNMKDGSLIKRLEPWEGHKKTIKSVRFSPDGNWLATAGEDQTIMLWSVPSFKKFSHFVGHTKTVNSLAWCNDSNKLLSASSDSSIREWDLLQPFSRNFEICNYGPWQTPVSNDSRYFAAPCSDEKLYIYETGSAGNSIELGKVSGLCSDFSNNNHHMVTASFDGIIRLWDIDLLKETRSYSGHTGRVDGIAIYDKGEQIFSVGDTTLRIWSLNSSELLITKTIAGHPFRIVLSPDETKAYISLDKGRLMVLNTETLQELNTIQTVAGIQEIAVSPKGNYLAIFSGKQIEIRDASTLSLIYLLSGHEQSGYAIGFSPDEKYLISGSSDQTFKLWRMDNGRCTFTFHGFEDTIYSCKWIGEKQLLLTTSQGKVFQYFF